MYNIATLNKISSAGLCRFTDKYKIVDDIDSATGIMVRSQDMLSMNFSENLLAIARAGAGVNNIPSGKCAENGIVVFNTPGANANAVKELVVSGLMLAARNLSDALSWAKTLKENTDDVAKAVEKGKSQFAGSELKGKTLGVIGLGAIGVLVANTARSLGMKVIGYDPYITLHAAHELSNEIPVLFDLGDLLPRCDYVTIHVPANDATKGMLNSKRFDQMKEGAVLLNFSRDKLVNDDNLLGALNSGKISKYITDFPNNKVVGHEKIVCLPHLGASTAEAEDNCAVMAAEQLMDYIENGNITNSVNFPACSLGSMAGVKERICILNKNVPSVIGKLTGILADMDLNIGNMVNRSKGDFACTLIDIDTEADDAKLLRGISTIDGIIRTRLIK
ncbi:MAG: 3-phosphoglycerate dehydrogenase [Clostridia bacterium]|nr:3-phosphoglycerate dehydrogenase [Clostridia bacterium]